MLRVSSNQNDSMMFASAKGEAGDPRWMGGLGRASSALG